MIEEEAMREAYEHGWIKFDGAHLSLPLVPCYSFREVKDKKGRKRRR